MILRVPPTMFNSLCTILIFLITSFYLIYICSLSHILYSLLYKQYEHYEKRGDFFYPIINNALGKIETRKVLRVTLEYKQTLKEKAFIYNNFK